MDRISPQVEKECSQCSCNPYLGEECHLLGEGKQYDPSVCMQDENTLLNQFDQQSKELCGRIEKRLDSSLETADVVESVQEIAANLASMAEKSSDEDVMKAAEKALKLWGELRQLQVSNAPGSEVADISQNLLKLGEKLLQIHGAARDRIISRSL
jgi:hypothetical protein